MLRPLILRRLNKRRHAHRARRGLSMFEAVLTIFVGVIIVSEAIRFFEVEGHKKRNLVEIQRVADLADLGERYVRRDLQDLITTIGVGNILQVSVADLEATGLVMDGFSSASPTRRAVDLWLYAPKASEVIVLARAHGTAELVNVPSSVAGTGLIGYVADWKPTVLQGVGLNWDVSTLQAALGWPAVNDLIAVRYLNFDADVRPYLHRDALTVGGVVLNQMSAPLDMGGNDIVNAGNLSASQLTLQTLIAEDVVSGVLESVNINVTDAVSVSGTLTTVDATIAGAAQVEDMTVNGELTAGSVSASGAISAASAEVEGTISANAITVATELNAESVVTGSLGVGSDMTADQGVFQTVVTGGCTGC
ncbi:hypothetical protein [Yoonia sp. R2-816]|uniref:hypothetical protein n=1 Tax=Yoonia sp. R2-816 TaxID=3342638 RepID=UPI003726356D